ncbi:DNA mismatch endonuclease Vsr [Sphingomonas sp. ZT3P38]|uniref:very short patch repair endonuclease n=1 Tax=Parasphingomonas zepuensis TaxID=3096161 RepID=UPI002FC9D0D6
MRGPDHDNGHYQVRRIDPGKNVVDVVDSATRSRMMSGIRSANTKPELRLRRALHASGFRFRLHDRSLPGSPDIVLPRWRVVIEVRGCFWHRHTGCRFTTTPGTRSEFWETKFNSNVGRDIRNVTLLREAGWRVAIVWECGLRENGLEPLIEKVAGWIRSNDAQIEIPLIPLIRSTPLPPQDDG